VVRPQVVVSFGPDGGYGHPDHIAICQLTSAALVCAADASYPGVEEAPHRVAKFFYLVSNARAASIISNFLGEFGIQVDGTKRRIVVWPDWAITTRIQAGAYLPVALEAIYCHRSQLPGFGDIERLPQEELASLVGENTFYRVFSLVNGGRELEDDLFTGLR
jgi:LmbE family N-acetylglucosaminyl deacetylase